MPGPIKIAVALPHYGGKCDSHHAEMWAAFAATAIDNRDRFQVVRFTIVDVCGIDRARNECVRRARDADADWLLMIDADTWVEDGGDLVQMISNGHKLGATIIGAAVQRRRNESDLGPTMMVYRQKLPGEVVSIPAQQLRHPGTKHAHEERLHCTSLLGVVEVDAIATACIAINMRHVEFMDAPVFRFTDIESEDIDFCRRVREMRGGWIKVGVDGKPSLTAEQQPWKGLILVDTTVKTFHLNRAVALRGP